MVRFSRAQLMVFGVTWLSYVCVYVARKPVSVTKVSLSEELGLTAEQLGAVDTAFLVTYTAGSFLGGRLGDLLGERLVVSAALALNAVGCFAFSSAGGYGQAVLAWGISGLAQGCVYPCCLKALGTAFPAAVMGQVTGLWCTAHYTGGIGGNVGGAYLLGSHGWRSAFAVPAAMLAATSVLAAALMPAPPSSPSSPRRTSHRAGTPSRADREGSPGPLAHVGSVGAAVHAADIKRTHSEEADLGVRRAPPVPPTVSASPQPDLWRLLRLPGLVNISAAYFFVKLVRYSTMFWLPYFLSHAMLLSESSAGYVATAFDAGGLLGTFSAGWASDKLMQGRRCSTALPLAVLTAAAFALYNWAYSATLLLTHVPALNVVLIGVFGGCIAGPDFLLAGPAAQELARNGGLPQATATVAGMVDGFGSLGAVMQGEVTSFTTERYGWSALYSLFSVMLLCTALLLARPAAAESRAARAKQEDETTV